MASTSEDMLADVGFMFDGSHKKSVRIIRIQEQSPMDIKINTIGDDPGHIQSGQYLWPAATALSNHICDVW